jgi:hypothetical protein
MATIKLTGFNTATARNTTGTTSDTVVTDGGMTIGDADTDTIIVNAEFDSDLIPDDTNTYDLGSTAKIWAEGHFGNLYIDEYIYHNGDLDTWVRLVDNGMTFKAGGLSFLNLDKKSSSPHELTVNDGSNNIDFIVKGNGSNEGNPLFKCDASTGRVGINGVGSPDCELHVDGDVKATGGVNAKLRHVNTSKYRNEDNTLQYVRWDSTGSNGSPGVNNKFIAPVDGELIKVSVRATSAPGATNVAFHKSANGTANLNTTAQESVGVDMAAANTTYTVNLTNSSFSAGEILGVSIDPTNTPNDVNVTCVWLLDWNA